MTSQGISFAEVLKRKIQKEAEDAKIRLAEEAKAREEEAKAKEARLAELKLKQERQTAIRLAQLAQQAENPTRYRPGGRFRFGQRSYVDRRRKENPEAFESVDEHGTASATVESESSSDAPVRTPEPENSAPQHVPVQPVTAAPRSPDTAELPAKPEPPASVPPETSVAKKPEVPSPVTLPTESKDVVKNCNAPEPPVLDSVVPVSVVSADIPSKKGSTPKAVAKQTNSNQEAAEKRPPTAQEEARLAQKKNGAQNVERRKNGHDFASGDSHGGARFRFPLYRPPVQNNGQVVPQYPGHYANGQVPGSGSQAFYAGWQYYQPVTEVTTRNGPLFVNPLAYPVYNTEMYPGNPVLGYYGQNGFYSNTIHGNGDMQAAPNVMSPQPSLIKSFYFDSEQAGVIIGKNGGALNDDRWKCDCEIWIDEQEAKLRGVSTLHLYGLEANVGAAVDRIRRRLESNGAELYPIIGLQTGNELHPPVMKLDLPQGVILEAFVSHVDESGLVFLQLPSHPTYLKIPGLEVCLSNFCSDNSMSPFIDVRHTPLVAGCIVAASVSDESDQWLRAMVISEPDEDGEIQLRSVDHGFPFQSHASNLKFLPAEFCVTPMQAIACRVVSGKFDYDRDVAEQIDEKVNVSVSKQWVRVKAVAEIMSTTGAMPVVEIFISSPSSVPVALSP